MRQHPAGYIVRLAAGGLLAPRPGQAAFGSLAGTDIVFLQLALDAIMNTTRDVTPQLYRRSLAIFLDGIRAEAEHNNRTSGAQRCRFFPDGPQVDDYGVVAQISRFCLPSPVVDAT